MSHPSEIEDPRDAELHNLRSLLSEVASWGLASHHDPADDAKGEELMRRISAACGDGPPQPDPRDTLISQLRECLQLLHDYQNGCPLPKYEAEWTRAMRWADELLGLSTARPTEEKAAPSGNHDSRQQEEMR